MKTLSKIGVAAIAPALALTLMASPASAQRYYDRDRDNSGRDAVVGALVGGLAGAIIGNGDGRYVAGGALAGAAIGAVSSDSKERCDYYRGGRCYRSQGHWERDRPHYGRDPRYNARPRGHYDHRDYRYDRRW